VIRVKIEVIVDYNYSMCQHKLQWNSFGPRPIYCSLCPNFISSFTSDHSCFSCGYHECNTCYKIEKKPSFLEKKKLLEEYKKNEKNKPISEKTIHEKFYNASKDGKIYAVRHYLNQGANKNTIMPNGYTALMIASENGHLDIVKYLLSIGVNVDIKNNDTKCAMLLAKNNTILLEFL